jgi:hypothetical protein
MLPDALGVYFWRGLDVPNALVPGLRLFQQSGFVSTTRIRLTPHVSPSVEDEYRFDSEWEAQVPIGAPFLPKAVTSTQYQKAFDLPGLRTIVLQAYDSASFGQIQDPLWLDTNAKRVRNEYRDMTVELYRTQNGKGKRFIISNWETDNDIYWFSKSQPQSAAAFEWFLRWFKLRQEGIRRGRKIAFDKGWGGVEVNDAIEFNSIYSKLEIETCPPARYVGDTLHNIIKEVKPDYASYSAWESTGRCRLYDDLMTVKQFLHAVTDGHTQLMIGELGVPHQSLHPSEPSPDPDVPNYPESLESRSWRYVQYVHAAIRAEIPVIILWKAFDDFGKVQGEGLFDWGGIQRQVLKDLIASFDAPSPIIATPDTMITGVVDQFDMYGWRAGDGKRYFEVYGNFTEPRPYNNPNSPNSPEPGWVGNYDAVIQFNNGQNATVSTIFESQSQLNIAMTPHPTLVRLFLLSIRRKRDGQTSAKFGPLRLNRIYPIPHDGNCKTLVNQRYWDFWP